MWSQGKFSPEGEFILQIGRAGLTGGDANTKLLGQPADMFVDAQANEVYVADGYLNHSVIVFDADTGQYKRHWGAYGFPPGDPRAPSQFGNPSTARSSRMTGLSTSATG